MLTRQATSGTADKRYAYQQDDLDYKEYSFDEPTKDLPLNIFEAPPPYGERIVTINSETEGSDKASAILRVMPTPAI